MKIENILERNIRAVNFCSPQDLEVKYAPATTKEKTKPTTAVAASDSPGLKSKLKGRLNATSTDQSTHVDSALYSSWSENSAAKLGKASATIAEVQKSGHFLSKNLTFNFTRRGRRPAGLRLQPAATHAQHAGCKPIAQSTTLNFPDFVDLFKAFAIRTRRDIKDLFDQIMMEQGVSAVEKFTSGSIECVENNERQRFIDALAATSVVANGTGPQLTGKQKCLDVQVFREFLEDYQELYYSDDDITSLVQVSFENVHYRIFNPHYLTG